MSTAARYLNALKESPISAAAGTGTSCWVGGELVTIKASGTETNGAYALMEHRTASRQGPPLHVHSREDEAFYVLEGRFLFKEGNREFTASPGAFVFLPRGTTHTYTNIGSRSGKLLVLATPAGIENFFTEVGQPGMDLHSQPAPPTEEQLAGLAETAARYGIEIKGPPLG